MIIPVIASVDSCCFLPRVDFCSGSGALAARLGRVVDALAFGACSAAAAAFRLGAISMKWNHRQE
jgi:hypothetical protein